MYFSGRNEKNLNKGKGDQKGKMSNHRRLNVLGSKVMSPERISNPQQREYTTVSTVRRPDGRYDVTEKRRKKRPDGKYDILETKRIEKGQQDKKKEDEGKPKVIVPLSLALGVI